MNAEYADGVLHRDGRDRGHAVCAERRKGFEVGFDACAAAGIALLRQRTDMLIIPSGVAVETKPNSPTSDEIGPTPPDSAGNVPKE